MEDLWRYPEAQQGHRRVCASGRGAVLEGELGQAPGVFAGAPSLVGQAGPRAGPGLGLLALCSESSHRTKFTLIFTLILRVSWAN